MSAVILGIGNLLLRDEGVGARAAQELERRFHLPDDLEVLDGGTSGIELMCYIAGKDLLVIIDAVKSGQEPGTVVRVEGDDVQATFRTRVSPHQIGLSDLLATTMLLGEEPRQMVLFGIEPGSMETGLGFTPEVAASFERLLGLVAEELRRAGYPMTARAAEDVPAPSVWAIG